MSYDSEEWRASAACAEVGPEVFFPPQGQTTVAAKRICDGCEVEEACLAYSLQAPELYGIWGGKSEHERRRIRNPR